ncbi:hypothetical protein PHMEG_00012710 [Phytophthora megakarya]|uniref:Uncharacterized protein n=1 Tax=Phytophthora megakarya TaxID=4795 RepID=A0A225W839_9STRA|nr:hypothetical protein PHMEG_00012710 [Phytophthora megakarya]
MVRQVSHEGISVPALQGRVAAGQDAGLVPSLLAAAAFLSSPEPSSPTAPLVLLDERPPEAQGHVDIDLGGLTLDELTEFLPADAALPLDVVVCNRATPHSKEEWEDDDDTDHWVAVNLIRASLAITERPPLPSPPKRHLSATWWNHFNPEAEVDTEADYSIRKLIDWWGEPPHVAYLVEWDIKPCQLSWEWPENLKWVYWCIDQGNKGSDPSISFNRYYGKSFGCAGDSKSGRCFLHAFQAVCFGLGKPGLVNRDHWDRFRVTQGNNFPDGVVPEDIGKFFNFVRAERVPLVYVELFKVYSHMTLLSTAVLDREARKLPPGHYILQEETKSAVLA